MIKIFKAIGIMSGTSLDGVDICYCQFSYKHSWKFKIICGKTFFYDKTWKKYLSDAINYKARELMELNYKYGKYLGHLVNKFIREFSISQVDIIGSHGHTVFHEPNLGYTTQIGDGNIISMICNLPVVYDFRSQDVAMGGQGAPLVPMGDKLLFSSYDSYLNLGGFSNISFIDSGTWIAYDICPLNIVLNHISKKLNYDYDINGELSKQGTIIPQLLQKLNELQYYKLNPPKSLGFEWVQKVVFPILNLDSSNLLDLLRTCIEHFAIQIGASLDGKKRTLCSGGGVYNKFLLSQINKYSNSDLIVQSESLVKWKEALIFAFLAVLRKLNKNNIISSVTGAYRNHCSGIIVDLSNDKLEFPSI